MPPAVYVGLMSGNSLDGVDAVLAGFEPDFRLIASLWRPYPEDLKQALLDLHAPGLDELNDALVLSSRLADIHVEAVHALLEQSGLARGEVGAIGSPGLPVRRRTAPGHALWLNDPARLAERTGISVVADFHSRDLAAGGRGGPLAPTFHAALFRRGDCHRVVVDIGGIAHITDLPGTGPIRAFDCGPGNLLMDAWVKRHWGCDYDPGGSLSSQGHVLPGLLQGLLVHPFLALPPPKSAGREDFGLDWLHRELGGSEREEDVLATLLELTVRGIANGIRSHCPGAREVWLCGGGAHNEELVRSLATYLPGLRIGLIDELGMPVDWVESCAWAWQAQRTLQCLPGNLPEVTGAMGPRVLGAIYPA
ncbi:MAG: anhydro-N-acetylmuramic acid kinase [Thiobacillaceae bacterium]|nr:anhydro-N-acetylmuramic acid kinase [Thiobacillaceae bacterium]